MTAFSACDKNPQSCDDPQAINFDAYHETGPCRYLSKVDFWKSDATSEALIDQGAVALDIWIDSNLIGTHAAAYSFETVPNCVENSSPIFKEKLPLDSVKLHQYVIIGRYRDANGEQFADTVVNSAFLSSPQGCQMIEIVL